ncbi:MAG: hypothetical protein QOG49_950 [Frankiaceae bacterium]|nr:hypothetical protein [Frankiaceae bacterium]
MEVKIGVQHAARELTIDSGSTADEVASVVSAALAAGGVLTLADTKGRKVIVPVDKLAYVEIAESESRPLGFGRL